MGKRKCTQKQLDALARGRAKRLRKTTKAAFQPQFKDILLLMDEQPIKKKPENKQHKIDDFFSISKKPKPDILRSL